MRLDVSVHVVVEGQFDPAQVDNVVSLRPKVTWVPGDKGWWHPAERGGEPATHESAGWVAEIDEHQPALEPILDRLRDVLATVPTNWRSKLDSSAQMLVLIGIFTDELEGLEIPIPSELGREVGRVGAAILVQPRTLVPDNDPP